MHREVYEFKRTSVERPWDVCVRTQSASSSEGTSLDIAINPPNKWWENKIGFQSTVSYEEYIQRIESVRKQIKKGECYQVNVTYMLRKKANCSAFECFEEYYKKNPGEYFAFLNLGASSIYSMSPELFYRRSGQKISMRPIKGTSKIGSDPSLLIKSEKNRAELNMITDLVRNDLFQICEGASVKCNKTHSLLIQKDLYHLYSEISGDLRDGVDHLKTIETLFPSGSICGCPKLKSAQKILDCESHDRGIYTGMIGFVSADEEVTSVAIRTGFSHEGFHYFSTGGGIVYDSVPFEEWQETLLKAESFLRFF